LPVPTRLAHSADQATDDRGLHDAIDAQILQRFKEPQFAQRMQADLLHPHRPGLRHPQRIYIDFLEV
jgi:hypothetical protein